MKKVIRLVLLALIFVLIRNANALAAAPSGNWSSFQTKPSLSDKTYTIASAGDLAWLAGQVNTGKASFSGYTINVTAPIDLSAHYWTPIGKYDGMRGKSFQGIFNGNNQKISGLRIGTAEKPDGALNAAGLFGYIRDAAIQDVEVENAAIYTAKQPCFTGGIAAAADGKCTLTGCHVTGYMSYINGINPSYPSCMGGVLGRVMLTSDKMFTITNCWAECCINGSGSSATGGLTGEISGRDISGQKLNYQGFITNCYALGTVRGADGYRAGGLVGYAKYTTIQNCFTRCYIRGTGSMVAGFVGNAGKGTYVNNYAAGSVDGNAEGKFFGNSESSKSTISHCIYRGTGSGLGATSMTQEDMQSPNFTKTLNDNMGAIGGASEWNQAENGGYPKFTWVANLDRDYAPLAVHPVINGNAKVGETLLLSYDYFDMGGYDESGSVIQWYRSAAANETNAEAIQNENQSTYKLNTGDLEKYIFAGVTPANGHKAGLTVKSNCTDMIEDPNASEFAGGTGKSDDPYIIKNLNQLKKVQKHMNAFFKLDADISGLDTPLRSTDSFTGDFDGQGHTVTIAITNLAADSTHVGMFARIGRGGKVHDLNISGSLTGRWNIGGLTGYNLGTIANCHASVSISPGGNLNKSLFISGLVGGNDGRIETSSAELTMLSTLTGQGTSDSSAQIGGIVGENTGTISGCSSKVNLDIGLSSFNTINVGGLIGYNWVNGSGGSIDKSWVTGTLKVNVTSTDDKPVVSIGSIAGCDEGGAIEGCFASANITGSSASAIYLGGLVGYGNKVLTPPTIKTSYFSGTVTGTGSSGKGIRAGGLVGYLRKGTIACCYNTGNVTGNGGSSGNICVGGLAGYNEQGKTLYSYSCGSGTATGGGSTYNGGLFGKSKCDDQSYATSCYWNGDKTSAALGDASLAGTKRTTAQMTVYASANMSGLNFTDDFVVKAGDTLHWYYPQLSVLANSTDDTVKTASLQSVQISACDITAWNTPANPQLNGSNAVASVPSGTETISISVEASSGASWKLYSDADCKTEIADKTVVLKDGDNRVYIRLTNSENTANIYTLTIRRTSTAKAITSFSVSSWAGIVDEAIHTIKVMVPLGTDLKALAATFTTTGSAVKVGNTQQESGVTLNDFTNPVAYTVIAEDGSTQDYTVIVTVAKALQGITNPAPITDVANGTTKTAAALGLPATVSLVTDQGNVSTDVTWDVGSCSYDVSQKSQQTFTVNGSVILPDSVMNPSNVSLTATITVTANAATVEYKVLQGITAPADITGVANGAAKTAAALGLPATINLVTDQGNVIANVTWDVDSSTYDVSQKGEQTFTVNGTVILPDDVVNPNHMPLTVSISVTVNAADVTERVLQGVTAPAAITGVANGAVKTAAALGLPAQVTLITDQGNVSADVTWDVDSSTYDVSQKDEQTFTVNGTVILPNGVLNPNHVSLTTSISVTVDAVVVTDKVLQSIIAPAVITGVANGTAKTAAALGLPAQVILVTDKGNVSAGVTWDVDSAAYDISQKSEQTFTVNGTVILSGGVVNPNNVPLTTSISVTVNKTTATVKVASITIVSAGDATSLVNGNTLQMSAVVLPANAADASYTWSLESGTGSATISAAGLLTATGVGTVNVKATAHDGSGVIGTKTVTIIASAPSPGGGSGGGRGYTAITNPNLIKNTDSGDKVKLSAAEINQVKSLTVKGNGVDLIFSESILTGMNIRSYCEITVKLIKTEALSPEARAIIGTRPAFNINVIADGQSVTTWEGKLRIEIPYTPQPGEDTSQLAAYYIADDGTITQMADSYYDPEKKAIVFTTNHLSIYAVGLKTDGAVKNKTEDKNNEVKKFTDVSGHWAEPAINYLAGHGIVSGKTAAAFAPNDNITRAEFVTILAKMSGNPLPQGKGQFSDVGDDDWYAPYAAWAAQKGVARGYNSQFRPDDLISRQDMAVMLINYADKVAQYKLPQSHNPQTFADDKDIAGYARSAVYTLQQAGIVSGQGGNAFNPTASATRAEAAQMIAKLWQGVVK